jgi:uncharacterized protein YbjT (DUF2867 family)
MVLRNKMSNSTPLKLLLLGGTGALGAAIADKYKAEGYEVTFGVRTLTNPADQFLLPITEGPVPDLLKDNFLMQLFLLKELIQMIQSSTTHWMS